jgi:uncharacterized protein (TIGR03083 family)
MARREAGLDLDKPWVDEFIAEGAPKSLAAEFFPVRGDDALPTVHAVPTVEPLELPAVRALASQQAAWISARLARCDASDWALPTRCGKWNVGALAAHLVTGQRFAHAVLTAAIEGRKAEIARDFRADRATTVEVFDRASGEVVKDLARLPSELLEKEVIIGDGAALVQHLVQVVVMELSVHGLDLADALGDTRHLTADAVAAVASALPDLLDPGPRPRPGTTYVLRSLAFELPFTWRDDEWHHEMGPDPTYIDGDAESVLLYALGRVSYDDAQLRSANPDQARAFKHYLTGP